MAILDFLRKKKITEEKNSTISSESTSDEWRRFLGNWGAYSTSGVQVTTRMALETAVVIACASVIANGISQVPFRLYRKLGNTRRPAEDHPLFWLFEDGPNPYQSQFEFRETIALHLALEGEAFVWLNRVRGEIVEMLPFNPGTVSVMKDPNGDGWRQVYTVTTATQQLINIPQEDMWHLRWRGYGAVRGMSPVSLAKNALGLSSASSDYIASSIREGVRPSGILTATSGMGKEQQMQLRKEFQDQYSGSRNVGKTMLLSNDLKYQPMSMTNEDAQFIENREFLVRELCQFWGVLPSMVYLYTNTMTFSSAEQLFLQHKVMGLDPWYRRIETSSNKFVLNNKQRRDEGLYFKFNADGLLRGDSRARMEVQRASVQSGFMTPNEARVLNELNPIEGGDQLFMQGGMETVENIIKRIVSEKISVHSNTGATQIGEAVEDDGAKDAR